MKMKVLMVNGTYGGVSGSGRAVKLLSEQLIRRGHNVSLCTNQTIGFVNIPKLKSLSFTVLALAKLKQKFDCDVVHVHNPKFSVIAKNGFPNVLTIHGDYLFELDLMYGNVISRLFHRWFSSSQMKKFRRITCVSPYWSRIRGWNYVPNGLNLEEIGDITPSNERYVLFVGRKNVIKGYDLFERAVRQLHLPYKMLGVYERVPWQQVISYMKSAYCLVLPSMQEGLPYVILEAWASGCPVIATDLPSLRSFGEGAIYFLRRRDVDSIRFAIRVMVEDSGVAEKLSKAGKQRVKDFDIKKVTEQYIDIYKKCL